MTFKLSKRSLSKLDGVKPKLVEVVKSAISITAVDFGVIEGVRSIETQRKYFAAGKTQTIKSKHLTGDAVDLMAYVGSTPSWEVDLYDDIAFAMKIAAINSDVRIRWGGAWHINDICEYQDDMSCAMNEYIDLRRSQGKRPFIDAVHFELS